jgi:hypothetical protein
MLSGCDLVDEFRVSSDPSCFQLFEVSGYGVDIDRHVAPVLQITLANPAGVNLGLLHGVVVVFLHEVVGKNTQELPN